jgi:hypothetical protein
MIGIVSLCVGDLEYRRILKPCIDSVWDYCALRGYQCHLTAETMAPDRPVSWGRIPLLQTLMAKQFDLDWLVWIDADAMVTNPMFRLEPLIEHMAGTDRLVAYTIDGANNLNDGVAIYRNDPRTMEYLQWLWGCTEYIDHPWWANAAAVRAQADRREFFEAHVLKVANTNLLNSYVRGRSPWKVGDFIAHFAGMTMAERAVLIPAFRRFSAELRPFLRAAQPYETYLGV